VYGQTRRSGIGFELSTASVNRYFCDRQHRCVATRSTSTHRRRDRQRRDSVLQTARKIPLGLRWSAHLVRATSTEQNCSFVKFVTHILGSEAFAVTESSASAVANSKYSSEQFCSVDVAFVVVHRVPGRRQAMLSYDLVLQIAHWQRLLRIRVTRTQLPSWR
jgi:hypothetical protein